MALVPLVPSQARAGATPEVFQDGVARKERSAIAAAALLEEALRQSPDHPELLADLAGLRIQQGDPAAAEVLATRLVGIDPQSSYAWELLALSRYLQDDTHGALSAWNRAGRPRVGTLDVRVLGHRGPRASGDGADPDRVSGIARGGVLTGDALVRGERRLAALPAAERARLGYRMSPEGEAQVDGAVVLGAANPFTRLDLIVHALRLVGRRVHLESADPLGRLERWEASGSMEGTLHEAGVALAHPAPGGHGVWRWDVDHETGRYGSFGLANAVRVTSTHLGWSHTDWLTSTLRGSVHGRVDVRPERGRFVGVGTAWSLLPRTARGALGAEGTAWTRVGGDAPDRNGPEPETRFGRAEIRGVVHAVPAGVGLDMRGGVVAVSRGIPPDLMPRIGAGGNADLLMRARSDLDDRGVVRPLFPGTAWAHAAVEVHRSVATLGPVGIGVALFADGVTVLAPEPASAVAAHGRGAVHLGGGLRARIPWVDGWLRADWGVEASSGASTFSAAWVQEHRLNRPSAR